MRVVSLVPGATETLAWLGAACDVVGCSHECETESDSGAAVVTRTRTALGAEPQLIDEAVRQAVAVGRPLIEVDHRAVIDLRPDVVVVQDLCGVCAAGQVKTGDGDVGWLAEIQARGARVVRWNGSTIDGVLDDIAALGAAVARERQTDAAVVGLRERMFRVTEHVNPFTDGPAVLFLEWTDPLYVGGHWTPQLIERAGGRHSLNPTRAREGTGAAVGPQMAERVAGRSVRVTAEVAAAVRPEALIVCPCGVPLESDVGGSAGTLTVEVCTRALLAQEWARELPAVRAGRVALVDGRRGFTRPGPGLVTALEFLVGWLNGLEELIPSDFAWRRWSDEKKAGQR